MHYYLDGYNLMFRTLHAGQGKDLQAQREKLIYDINQMVALLEMDVTIVFDAQYQYGEGTRSHFDTIGITFTRKGETADEYILHELKGARSPQFETVVTSDKKLAWLARRHMAKTETVEVFLESLIKRYKARRKQEKKALEEQEPRIVITKLIKLKETKVNITEKQEINPDQNPSKTVSAQECFDYYLERFEKESEELIANEPKYIKAALKTTSKVKKDKKKKDKNLFFDNPETEEEQRISDMERWLMAFEKGGKKNEEF